MKYTFVCFMEHIFLSISTGFKMKRRCNWKGAIVFITVLCLCVSVWITSSMKTIRVNSDDLDLNKNKIENSFDYIQRNTASNGSEVITNTYNRGMKKDQARFHKIPNGMLRIARDKNAKQVFLKRKQLLGKTRPGYYHELNSDKLTVDELLAARSPRTYVESEMDKLNREKLAAYDPRLVKLIRQYFIKSPSNLPYNLHHMNTIDTSMGQAAFVDNRLGFKENGFFVESGAHDGEYLSNTLFLERTRHWTGVLIEPLSGSFEALQQKRRKAYTINACLSIHPYPSIEHLSAIPVVGSIVQNTRFSQRYDQEARVPVQCFPLHSILLALNQPHVDFLSLDIEGVEKQVLDAIPWNKVDISMFAIEFDKWLEGKDALCKYMESNGYECSVTLQAPGAADVIFRKRYY